MSEVLSALGIESVVSIVIYTWHRRCVSRSNVDQIPPALERYRTVTDRNVSTFASPMIRLVAAIALLWPNSL